MSCMTKNYPDAAFILAIAGGVLIVIGGLAMAFLGALCGTCVAGIGAATQDPAAGIGAGTIMMVLMSIGFISGILVLIGAFLMQKDDPETIKKGSIIAIIFSIFGLAGLNPVSFIGALLGIIGGVIGITWKPQVST